MCLLTVFLTAVYIDSMQKIQNRLVTNPETEEANRGFGTR